MAPILLALALLAAPVTGYQGIPWGSTPAQVQARFPSLQVGGETAAGTVSVDGHDVTFVFASGRLVLVSVDLGSPSKRHLPAAFARAEADLVREYGAADRAEPDETDRTRGPTKIQHLAGKVDGHLRHRLLYLDASYKVP